MPRPTTAFSMVNFDYHCDRHTNRRYQTRTSDYMIKFKGIRIHTLSIPYLIRSLLLHRSLELWPTSKKLKQKTVKTLLQHLQLLNRCFFFADYCKFGPCQNGGTCLPDGDSYICVCAAGYGGINCTTSKMVSPFSHCS